MLALKEVLGAGEDPASRNSWPVGTDMSAEKLLNSKVMSTVMETSPGCSGSRSEGPGPARVGFIFELDE